MDGIERDFKSIGPGRFEEVLRDLRGRFERFDDEFSLRRRRLLLFLLRGRRRMRRATATERVHRRVCV